MHCQRFSEVVKDLCQVVWKFLLLPTGAEAVRPPPYSHTESIYESSVIMNSCAHIISDCTPFLFCFLNMGNNAKNIDISLNAVSLVRSDMSAVGQRKHTFHLLETQKDKQHTNLPKH